MRFFKPFTFVVLLLAISLAANPAHAIDQQRVLDIDGQIRQLPRADARATVVVFLGAQCPVSNKYIPTLNEIHASFKDRADFFAVISDPTIARKDVVSHRDEFKIALPLIDDVTGSLAQQFQPTCTPEVFVLDGTGQVLYRGRIDDLFVDIGKQSQVVKSHDLIDALTAITSGKPLATARTQAVGCAFEAWNNKSAPTGVTYARQIASILNANCVSCHRAGEIAPFSLNTYPDAAKHAQQIAAVTASHYMPPWKPAPGFGHFLGEQHLSDREISLLSAWADAGAPMGEAAEVPQSPTFSSDWQLGKPDMVVQVSQPFIIPASGRDIYRAFVIPLDLPAGTVVAGIEFRPSAKSVVHHALLFLDNTEAARALDQKDTGPGYSTFGGVGFSPVGGLGGWAPGAAPSLLPEGVGRIVPRGSDLVLQIHYHPDGKERQDQSSVAIYLQHSPVHQIVTSIPVGTRQIDIPPGEANYTREIAFDLPVDLTLNGITPHMHLLGREMKVLATTPDGKAVPLIWIKDWDFKWQGQYRFAEPIKLPKGTHLTMTTRYDNSAGNPSNPNDPPQRVTHGEQTTDEMCLCFLEFLASTPKEAADTRAAVLRELVTSAVIHRLMGN